MVIARLLLATTAVLAVVRVIVKENIRQALHLFHRLVFLLLKSNLASLLAASVNSRAFRTRRNVRIVRFASNF